MTASLKLPVKEFKTTKTITQTSLIQPNVAISNREIKLKQVNAKKTGFKSQSKEKSPRIELREHNVIPAYSLLKKPIREIVSKTQKVTQNVREQSEIIVANFKHNNIDIILIKAVIGPIFINYHIRLNPPIDQNKIQQSCLNLQKTLDNKYVFLNQSNPNVADYQLLISRNHSEQVSLIHLFSQESFANSNRNLIVALGINTNNQTILASLDEMPNLFIVGNDHFEVLLGIKAVVTSLIVRYTSDDLKIILMGQNKKAFTPYVKLPHLLTPLVNQSNIALNILNWCLAEMGKRLQILKFTHTNDIHQLNQKIYEANKKNILMADPLSEDVDRPNALRPLCFLIIFIDKLDWLKDQCLDIDNQIVELARYSKEIGIHLVVSESHLSIQSINQSIQHSFPTKLAFQLSSRIDSLLILHHVGAEKLIGGGDALLLTPSANRPIRLQIGTLNHGDYLQLINNFQSEPKFDDTITDYQTQQNSVTPQDDLYNTALQHVLNARKTSISFVQRTMKIGYNLANKLLTQMEINGILSKIQSDGTRNIINDH